MTVDTISDVLTRVTAIEQQLQQLQGGSPPGGTGASSSGSAAGAVSPAGFAGQLAQAQGSDGASAGGALTTAASGAPTAAPSPAGYGSPAAGAPGTTSGPVAGAGAGAGAGGVTLPAAAGSLLTAGQQQFASTLSADTGLNPGVVTSWLLAEESGSAAQSRQSGGNNDWLNIGYTDSGTHGASDSAWSDPVSAANATAAWMQGQPSVPGYGTASAGIQAILGSVGQTPDAQIQAIQSSGWSSGGYPSLGSLYRQVSG